jgi:hypothetical protein
MASRNNIRPAIAACACIILLACAGAKPAGAEPSPDETALHRLWLLHLATPGNHETVITACRAFETQYPESVLFPVARGLLAWRLMKDGQTADAGKALAALSDPRRSTFDAPAAEMARRWLTRLDVETVRAALRVHYQKQIAYPSSLDDLVLPKNHPRPPKTDRWDQPWKYEAAGLQHIAGTPGQTYRLQSLTLGAHSDLASALQRPYAGTLKVRAVQTIPGKDGGHPSVSFELAGARPRLMILAPGSITDAFTFCHAGETILVLSDGEYWLVLPRPRP